MYLLQNMTFKKYNQYKQDFDIILKEYTKKQKNSFSTLKHNFTDSFYKSLLDYIIHWWKRFRPILSRIFYEAFANKNANKKNQEACMLFEFFHNYTLIHDDIYDQDDLRRSRESIHAIYKKEAKNIPNTSNKEHLYQTSADRFWVVSWIIAGKLMHNFSYKLLSDLQIDNKVKLLWYELLSDVYEIDNFWQALDLYFEFNKEKVTQKDYFKMINLKTSRLITNSCLWWAHLANVEKKYLENIKIFGQYLWEAFQLHDDLIDLDEHSKKWHWFWSDIKQWKKTLIVLHFLKNASINDKKIFNIIFNNTNASKEELEIIVGLFKKTKSIEYVKTIRDKKNQKTVFHLDKLKNRINIESYNFLKDIIFTVIK